MNRMMLFQFVFAIIVLMITVSGSYAADDLKLLLDKTLQTESGKLLDVNTLFGEIKITVSDGNEARVKIFGNNNVERSMVFTAENVLTGIKVDGSKKEGEELHELSLRIEVTVPVTYNIKLNTGGGGVSVNGSHGKINFNTAGGNVDVEKIVGDIDGSTAGGNVKVLESKGLVKISTAGGNVLVSGFDGDVDISTAGGNIALVGSNGKVSASTAGGNIALDYAGENLGIDLSTAAGKIKVELPANFNADADVSTLVGKIKCDFASVEQGKIMANLKGKFNDGGKPFKCSTAAGDIMINKK